MKLRKGEILSLLIALIAYPVAYYFYLKMPDFVATHWNAQGQVDGYSSRFWGTFVLPFVLTIIVFLLVIIPRLDPKKNNISKFTTYFDRFILCMMIFFAYVFGLTIYWNLGHRFNFSVYMLPAFSALFYVIGDLVANAEPNYSIGIRTPWTLANENVWKKTHSLGGKAYKITGLLTLSGLLFPNYAMFIFLTLVIAVSLYLVIYSYLEFKK